MCELKNKSIENIWSEEQKVQRIKVNKQNLRKMWETIMYTNVWIISQKKIGERKWQKK